MNNEAKIAYFSMEIGLSNDIPTYSGGLGVLAGDTIKSGADLKVPLVAVTLLSKKGYFRQPTPASTSLQPQLYSDWYWRSAERYVGVVTVFLDYRY